jgi:glycosyltransferase involved in cell wall biosynthesis
VRILWVKTGKLLPVDTGGKIRSFNLLRHLARRHDVTLLSYYQGPVDAGYERALAEALPGAIAMAGGGQPASRHARITRYLGRLAHPAPYAITNFTERSVRQRVTSLLGSGRFDVAVCDFLAASLNFAGSSPIPIVLFQHNVESALWDRRAKYEGNSVKRIAFSVEAAKMRWYERRAVRRFDRVIAVSDHDRQLFAAMADAARIDVAVTGVDTSHYRRAGADGSGSAEPIVLFLGSMDWEPNIDGVEYFCRDIWPTVSAAVPTARFRVVGRNPHARVMRLAGARVDVTGGVPSVVEHLHEASVVVVPLRVGGGTRLKIYEAMAAGRAVVSTSVGAEGLDVTNGADIVLADDAPAFAASVIELLRDDTRRRALENSAAALAARYDWSAIAEGFAESLASARDSHHARSQSTARPTASAGR